jgi:hypothetical protein
MELSARSAFQRTNRAEFAGAPQREMNVRRDGHIRVVSGKNRVEDKAARNVRLHPTIQPGRVFGVVLAIVAVGVRVDFFPCVGENRLPYGRGL